QLQYGTCVRFDVLAVVLTRPNRPLDIAAGEPAIRVAGKRPRADGSSGKALDGGFHAVHVAIHAALSRIERGGAGAAVRVDQPRTFHRTTVIFDGDGAGFQPRLLHAVDRAREEMYDLALAIVHVAHSQVDLRTWPTDPPRLGDINVGRRSDHEGVLP